MAWISQLMFLLNGRKLCQIKSLKKYYLKLSYTSLFISTIISCNINKIKLRIALKSVKFSNNQKIFLTLKYPSSKGGGSITTPSISWIDKREGLWPINIYWVSNGNYNFLNCQFMSLYNLYPIHHNTTCTIDKRC